MTHSPSLPLSRPNPVSSTVNNLIQDSKCSCTWSVFDGNRKFNIANGELQELEPRTLKTAPRTEHHDRRKAQTSTEAKNRQ